MLEDGARFVRIRFSLSLFVFGMAFDSFSLEESLCSSIGRSLLNVPVKYVPEHGNSFVQIKVDRDMVFGLRSSGQWEYVRELDNPPLRRGGPSGASWGTRPQRCFSPPRSQMLGIVP